MLDQFERHLALFVDLTPEEKLDIRAFLKHKKVSGNDILLKQGNICQYFCFVSTGQFRLYHTTEKGEQYTVRLASEGSWIGDMLSLNTKSPSNLTIEALEDSDILMFDRESLDNLFQKCRKFESYMRIINRGYFIDYEKAIIENLYKTEELNKVNKDLDAFNYSLSHDMKTPLRVMDIYIALLKSNTKGQEENQEFLRQLDICVLEMKNMISYLLEFSKYGNIELKKEHINMDEEIHSCIGSLSLESSFNQPEFKVQKTPGLFADKGLLKNVLTNLISNAIKYSSKKENPLIEISGSVDKKFTTYYVKDNGAGFEEREKSKLFKPFSRLHNDTEFEGNGAGLAIVERIISRHGGAIWAEAEKEKGATFYFKLPNV